MPVSPIQVTVRDYLRILGQRKLWITLCIASGIILFYGYGKFFMKKVYRAQNSIEIIQPKEETVYLKRYDRTQSVQSRIARIKNRINHQKTKEEIMALLVTDYWIGKEDSLEKLLGELDSLRDIQANDIPKKRMKEVSEHILNILEIKNIVSRNDKDVEDLIKRFVLSGDPMTPRTERKLSAFFERYRKVNDVRLAYLKLESLYERSEIEIDDAVLKNSITQAQQELQNRVIDLGGTADKYVDAVDALLRFGNGQKTLGLLEPEKINSLFRTELLFYSGPEVYAKMTAILDSMNINVGGDYINIFFEWENPVFARDMVEVIIDILEKKNRQFEQDELSTPIRILKKQVKEYRRAMLDAKDDLKKFKRENYRFMASIQEKRPSEIDNVNILVAEENNPIAQYLASREEIRKLEEEILETRRIKEATYNAMKAMKESTYRSEVLQISEERKLYEAKRAELQLELSRHPDWSEEHPQGKEMRRQIAILKRKIDNIEPLEEVTKERIPNPERSKAQAKLSELTAELAAKESILKLKEKRFNELERELDSYFIEKERLIVLEDEVKKQTGLYNTFNHNLEAAILQEKINMASGTKFNVIQETAVPSQPVRPNLFMLSIMGFMVGLFASGSLVLLLEFADHSIRDLDDARRHLEIPVLGTVSDFAFQRKDAHRLLSRRRLRWMVFFGAVIIALLAAANYDKLKEVIYNRFIQTDVKQETGGEDQPMETAPASTGTATEPAKVPVDLMPDNGTSVEPGVSTSETPTEEKTGPAKPPAKIEIEKIDENNPEKENTTPPAGPERGEQ